ncbi:hypothetical protein LAZ67_X001915 [Cordylochernes scorpioides]|uniref:Reverse transcriptase n=1 Tax=Cordylochernes scorpioides TaxID=51811 RepID=A0ABY6LV12_9ARAC|nr:hypothetical protein LAZ67_X001915 [Cordylochernes scorpioides]
MLENGIIEQSFSPFSSPVTLVTKRDKTKRFCIDYRKVNELISSDVHPLPRIEDILDRLAQAKYFSTADISSAYWQVPIHPDSRPLLAFATFEGLYQPTRLPFGLKTSPQIYERAISQVLQRHGLDCVAHYFDDFIIYSNTLEEHQNHLRQFFAFCEAEKLQLNFAKCEFFKQSIDFLGYTITASTITPLTRNTDTIHAIKQPHNRKTLQSFLGAVNVYNKFIPEYARLRAPLNNLLKKDVVWNWNEVCQKAFIDLKGNLTQHPILHLYKEGLPCQVYCDASTLGIAGILKQVHPDGNVYPVQYFSRTLRPHEKNYSISELECLAIVESVEKFHIYLMGRKFTIFSDHHALQWLKTIKNPSGRLFRWSLRLSSYEYEVRYIKGKLQYEADLLSRNPFCGFLDATLIKTHQPPPSKESIGPTYGELSQPPESKEPFDLLSLDTIAGFAKYGNTKIYLHVVVDHFSRYAWAFPSKSTSNTTYQQVLKRVFQDGSPKRLLTDRAPALTSPKFRSFLLNRNIHPLITTSNNPQANGLCERLNATLTGKLRLLHLENPKVAWTKLVKKNESDTRVLTCFKLCHQRRSLLHLHGSVMRHLERILERGNFLAYTDDVLPLICEDWQFDIVRSNFDAFRRASGVGVNFSQSKRLWCGAWKNRADLPQDITWSSTPIIVLGCEISTGLGTAIQESHLLGILEETIYKLRDALVCGILNGEIQSMLLMNSIKVAQDMALAHEAAVKNVAEIKDGKPQEEMNVMGRAVKVRRRNEKIFKCFRLRTSGRDMNMLIDSGTRKNIISEKTYIETWVKSERPRIEKDSTKLVQWNRQRLSILGKIKADVKVNKRSITMELLVIEGPGPNLIGREAFDQIGIGLEWISYGDSVCQINEVMNGNGMAAAMNGNGNGAKYGNGNGMAAAMNGNGNGMAAYMNGNGMAAMMNGNGGKYANGMMSGANGMGAGYMNGGEDMYSEGDGLSVYGNPGVDFPLFASVPETSFQCGQQELPGYYADQEGPTKAGGNTWAK